MKNTIKRIVAIGLVLAIITSVLNLNWNLSILANAQEKVEYEKDFTNLDLSTIDDEFTSSHIASDGTITKGKPSEQWSTLKQPTGEERWEYQNQYLKPKNNGGSYLLTLNNSQLSNFKASITFLNSWKEYGLVFGQSTPYDLGVSDTETNGAVKVRMQENFGKILAQGVKSSTAKWVDEDETTSFYYNEKKPYLVYDNAKKFSDAVNSTNLHTLNIEVNDGILKLWWTDFEEYAWTVELNDNYEGGYVSLYSNGCAQGGIKSFSFSGIREEAVDGENCDFTAFKYVYQLNRDFDAYLVEKNSETGIKGEPEDYWTTSDELKNYEEVYKNPWLKPMHLNGTGNNTLLTYSKKSFENLQVTTEFVTNYIRYGVMVAPLGKISTSENGGVRVYVESNGIINIEGAVDAATANAVGGQVKITDKNHLTGYPISDFVAPSNSDNSKSRTSYKLNVKIVDGVITVWMDEFASYKISAKLNGEYKGGYVSLYASGYNQGAFKSFKIEELESAGIATDEKTFNQSFNTIDSTDNLKENFAGYKFNNAGEKLVETNIGELFVLNDGKLKSNLAAKGTDDSGFAVLTLKNKKYKNFELNLSYEQDWLRYGVMLSSNIDEFAFTSNGEKLVPNGGVIAYTEAEGYTNIRGSLYTSCFTNKKQLLHRKSDITVSSFNSFGNPEKTLQKRPVHTLTVRVVNGYITMLVDGDESTRITQPLSDYNGGYISLITNATKGRSEGAFYGLTVTELEDDAELLVPVLEFVDGENSDFTNLGAVYQLNRDFDAYLIDKDQTIGIKGEADDYWTMSDNLENYETAYKNPWLKPMHRNTGDNTLLTYSKKSFENVQVTTEYVTNYVRYGVMVAPLGKISTAANGGVRVYVESNGIINIEGAVDASSGKTTKGQLKVVAKNHLSGYPIDGFIAPSNESNEISRTSYKLNVKIVNSVISVWLNEYPDYVITAKLTDKYKGGYVSLYASAYDQGAFKNFKVSEIETTAEETDNKTFTQSFNTISNLKELDKNFEGYILNSAEEKPKSEKIDNIFTLENGRLKSKLEKNGTDNEGFAILTLKNKRYENFELTLSYEQDWLRYGVMFGTELGEFAFTANGDKLKANGGVIAYTEAEGYTNVKGSVYGSLYTNAGQLLYRNSESQVSSFNSFVDVEKTLQKKPIHNLTIRVVNGYMTMIVDGDESTRITLPLSKYDGGYISLITNASVDRNEGAFYGITVTELSKDAELDVKEYPAINGSECDFTKLESVTQLGSDFDAYFVEKDSETGEIGNPGEYWTLSTNLPAYEDSYKNPWLKPMHRNTGDNTLLTYSKKSFENVQVTTEYVTNYVRYGVMVAPLGKISTAENGGVRVYVESNGIINIEGAVDAGSGKTTKGQLKVVAKNHLSGYAIDGIAGPSEIDNEISRTSYKLNVKIVNSVISVWLNEYPDYVITAKLTDKYKGGYVSLYASAYDQGAFKNFKVSEIETTAEETDNKTFTQSFNTISNLKELDKNFEGYILNSAEEKPKSEKIDNIFTLENGRLKSKLEKNGTDNEGFAILTLKNKRYENFELTLSYEQDWLRYGVMFGTELGEFAFTANGDKLKANGGVIAYTEAEGYTNVKGSVYGSLYTNAGQLLYRNSESQVSSFTSFVDVEKTLQKKPIHNLTIRVVNGYMTMIVDGDESTRITLPLSKYDGGYISLITNASVGRNEGAFYGITVTELSKDAELDVKEYPAINGSECDFTKLESVTQLGSDFDAYFVEKDSEAGTIGNPGEYWTLSTNLPAYEDSYKNPWLKPMHRNTGDNTLLTYSKKSFENVQVTTEYVTNYVRYGVMVAPLGKISTAENGGVRVYVESNGIINIEGAVDAGSGKTTKGQLKVVAKNHLSGYAIDGIAGPSEIDNEISRTSYKLNVKIVNSVISVWLNEYPDYVITAKLTDKYKGGYVSLYASAYDQGAFKNFKVSEIETTAEETDNKTFTQSFNTISNLKELDKNFEGYILNSAEEKPKSEKIDNIFTLENGRLKSKLEKNGTDNEGFAILTLKNKRYENFELTLSYEQDWLRYGVMFGTELGEFAFTANGDKLKANGGVIAYTEAEGYTNVKGSVYGSLYTNAGQLLYRNSESQVSSFTSFVDVEKTLQKKPIHNLTIRVVNGYMTMIVDGDESTRITLPLSKYDGGYISLITNASVGRNEGAFYGITVTELSKDAELDVKEYPAINGSECDFTKLESVTQLGSDFDAYFVEKDSEAGTIGNPGEYWTLSTNLPAYEDSYKNPWLKPMHRNTGDNTLLTYSKKSFENVQVTTEYVTNYVRYGVMVAPLGKISTSANGGVRVYVESNGIINIEGAVDASSGKTTKGQLKVVAKNHLSGYAIDGIVGPSETDNEISRTSYKLNVKIVNSVISVWLNEYPEYVITAKLTDKYKGGYVSLYASAYDQGAFKNFKVSEIETTAEETDNKTFTQSFNTISNLKELDKNFEGYILNSAEEKPKSEKIDNIFTLENGRLKSKLEKNGTDNEGFAILTLKNKRYENFELTLSYEQDWLRYGVMFGTELGEFAYNSNGKRMVGNGGIVAFTEAEGYTDAKGSMYASFYTSAGERLSRKSDAIANSFTTFNDVATTLQKRPIHTLTIRVVNGYMTMYADNDESTRKTIRLDEYDGGYISLVTNASVGRNEGAFYGITVTELSKDAKLGTEKPTVTDGFETLGQVEEKFDAYYLKDAEVSSKLEKVNLREHWWINNGAFLSRNNGASGIKETSDIDILTYKEKKFTDFELTYTYQQTYQRLGIMIGGDLKNYPITVKDGKLSSDNGALFYVEAEGYPNVKGHINNYTSMDYLIYRVNEPAIDGFMNSQGDASQNVNSKKVHTVKVVVKDKKLYAFIDGSKTANLYVNLGENYNGGYVSLFACAAEDYGIHSFEISDKITTKLPTASGVESDNKTYTANFDSVLFDDSAFETYYLDELKNNADGSLIKKNFDEMWTVANGTLKRNLTIEDGSDASKVSVLTYNKKLENFVIKYDYQKYDKRLMLMFGAEKGKYPLSNKGEGDLENGGVLLYPENDLGAGGGIIAIGGISPLTAAYRPVNRKTVTLKGYHIIDEKLTADQNWTSNFGSWHTMTIAVINKHCYIYLDNYGLIADYDLKDDYEGGYISLAAAGSRYGFDNISITDLSDISNNTIVSVENPRDITVKTGTKQSAIKLPSSVKATLKDGKTIELPVEWKTNHYDKDVEGIYNFTAILPENANVSNTALVSSVINIRVKKTKSTSKTDVKEWTFDTSDDLLDFKSTYLIDGEQGYTENNISRWYCNGELLRDSFRTINGSEKRDLSLLTYDGATYRNFELEVDYTQHYTRMGVLFGSSEPCQYIDLSNVHSENNPVMAFVEYEGVRNFIGNVKNTNFYTRIDETIYNARENGAGIAGYFTEVDAHTGNYHKMKIRVVGEEVSMWIDDCEVPFTATLTNYDGGYISLVSTTKGGKFDNLKITRLDDSGNPTPSDFDIEANGNFDLEIDKDASTELKRPDREAPEEYKKPVATQVESTLGTVNIIVGCAIFVLSVICSALFIIVAINKKRKKTK